MAAQTCIRRQHATLTTTTADSVTFSNRGHSYLLVTNHDATTILYFRTDGTTAVSAADETVCAPVNSSKLVRFTDAACSIVGNGNAYSAEVY